MILFINTSQTDLTQVKLINDGQVIGQLESREEYKQSELLLKLIDELTKSFLSRTKLREKFKNKNLTAIAVVSGPGAFSALRFGITTANTMAWSLGIPVFELSIDEVTDDEKLIQVLKDKAKSLKLKAKNFIPVAPKYGSEPNITTKKNDQ